MLKSRKRTRRKGRAKQRASLPPLRDDSRFVWGASAIASLIGRSRRATYHLLESEALTSAHKLGGCWVADVKRLLAEVSGEATS